MRSGDGKHRPKFDEDFRQDAVRMVKETGIGQMAESWAGTLGNWCKDRRQREGSSGDCLARIATARLPADHR
jgi:transposase-like protein